jgi:hypothetical protein
MLIYLVAAVLWCTFLARFWRWRQRHADRQSAASCLALGAVAVTITATSPSVADTLDRVLWPNLAELVVSLGIALGSWAMLSLVRAEPDLPPSQGRRRALTGFLAIAGLTVLLFLLAGRSLNMQGAATRSALP